MKPPTDSDLWDACKAVIEAEHKPLEVWRVAKAAGISEEEVIQALMRETLPRRKAVKFRYPPLPCAAITGIEA